jgi:putative tryptophan/tyrosine transport system substrate-binding protein
MDRELIDAFEIKFKSAFRNLKSAISLGALLFALCSSAEAQQPNRVPRIGYLDPSTASSGAASLDAFRQELSKLGWIERKNITIEYRFAEQEPKRLPELAAELVRLKVDVILCSSTPPVLAAKKATTTIPIVMASSGDAVATGLVASLARPGGNITGLTSFSAELAGKRLEILKETVPGITRVGVLWFSGGPGVSQRLQLKEIRAAALGLNLKLDEIELDPKGLESAFQTAIGQQVNAIIMASARVIFAERKRIVELATKYRLPAVYSDDDFVDEGGLLSYGNDRADQYRRAAVYVDKILKGTKPADLPVERPIKFELVINLKAAKQIGLTIPPNVLARADRVIK